MKELFNKIFKKMGDELFTIPNMLSILRLLLIPVIIYLYCFKQNNTWSLIVICFSALTDIVDGFIARRFNMITDFGKFLDPLADKATQVVVLICLVTKFPAMLIPCVILVIKEIGSLILRFIIFKNTEKVDGARWHGKLATSIVIASILSHLIWYDMSPMMSYIIIGFCSATILFSATLYTVDNIKVLRESSPVRKNEQTQN